jgi:peptide-methionine (S)-S-oxide reductase
MSKVGFGGGCHWCTEGVFLSLKGISKVEQGWISSLGDNFEFSEGVIVHYNPETISLEDLIEIHLHTHSSTSNHSMRNKYRSAVYVVPEDDQQNSERIIQSFQKDFSEKIVTQSLYLNDFKENKEEYLNYLYSRPESGFCTTHIHPKIRFLMNRFSDKVQTEKLNGIGL